jgi:hypothetical protein
MPKKRIHAVLQGSKAVVGTGTCHHPPTPQVLAAECYIQLILLLYRSGLTAANSCGHSIKGSVSHLVRLAWSGEAPGDDTGTTADVAQVSLWADPA